jgi:putative ABC transport system ATP-binding protein
VQSEPAARRRSSCIPIHDKFKGGLYALPINRHAVSAGGLARRRRAHIGFIFQAFHLITDMMVLDNVALALEGVEPRRRVRRERAMKALEQLGVAHRARHLPTELSGGQQQRVACARAMVREPALLICDEPTGNLDGESAALVLEAVEAMHASGTTVLLVTHDPSLAARAQRIVRLDSGRIEPRR